MTICLPIRSHRKISRNFKKSVTSLSNRLRAIWFAAELVFAIFLRIQIFWILFAIYFMPAKKLRILVTAGPTREMLDPVRFLSNVSTGHMGYQIAHQAKRMNAQVTLISGPTVLTPLNKGIRFVSVLTARDMKRAVL